MPEEKNKKKKNQKRSNQEIEQDKKRKIAELSEIEVSDVISETEEQGERFYARKFKALYNGARKSLVLLSKKRVLKMISSQEAYTQAREVLNAFMEKDE